MPVVVEAIRSDKLSPPVGPFSPAIRSGDFLFFSGQVGQNPSTEKLVAPLGQIAAGPLPLRECGVRVVCQFDRPSKLGCCFVPRWSLSSRFRFFHEVIKRGLLVGRQLSRWQQGAFVFGRLFLNGDDTTQNGTEDERNGAQGKQRLTHREIPFVGGNRGLSKCCA